MGFDGEDDREPKDGPSQLFLQDRIYQQGGEESNDKVNIHVGEIIPRTMAVSMPTSLPRFQGYSFGRYDPTKHRKASKPRCAKLSKAEAVLLGVKEEGDQKRRQKQGHIGSSIREFRAIP